jgi:hypothetical protein
LPDAPSPSGGFTFETLADAVAGKSIHSQEGTERCLTKADGKTVLSSFGTRAGTVGTLD